MKKLIHILKKCALALAIGLIISNITIPTPDNFTPKPGISPCTTEAPVEYPLDDNDYN